MFSRNPGCVILVLGFLALTGCQGPALEFSPEKLPAAVLNQLYDVEISATNANTPVAEFEIKSGKLPPGLSLEKDANQARITGTPTESGTFNFVVSASCMGTNSPGQTGEVEFSIQVK